MLERSNAYTTVYITFHYINLIILSTILLDCYIYITDVQNISPLIQLLEQRAKQQYEIKALAHSQVKVQPKTSESY
jgi:hypothetical protein